MIGALSRYSNVCKYWYSEQRSKVWLLVHMTSTRVLLKVSVERKLPVEMYPNITSSSYYVVRLGWYFVLATQKQKTKQRRKEVVDLIPWGYFDIHIRLSFYGLVKTTHFTTNSVNKYDELIFGTWTSKDKNLCCKGNVLSNNNPVEFEY